MAKQVIFVGTTPNDGTGDLLRNAMLKVNANFDELYTTKDAIHQHGDYKVPFGGTTPVTAANASVFLHGTSSVEFQMTVSDTEFDKIEISISAPSIILSGAQGPVAIQRVVDGVVTTIYAFIVSSIDNGYHISVEDDHGKNPGTVITYRLYNMTGSGGTGGTVTFPTTYGFQFCGKET